LVSGGRSAALIVTLRDSDLAHVSQVGKLTLSRVSDEFDREGLAPSRRPRLFRSK
jgi:hypothetical protein